MASGSYRSQLGLTQEPRPGAGMVGKGGSPAPQQPVQMSGLNDHMGKVMAEKAAAQKAVGSPLQARSGQSVSPGMSYKPPVSLGNPLDSFMGGLRSSQVETVAPAAPPGYYEKGQQAQADRFAALPAMEKAKYAAGKTTPPPAQQDMAYNHNDFLNGTGTAAPIPNNLMSSISGGMGRAKAQPPATSPYERAMGTNVAAPSQSRYAAQTQPMRMDAAANSMQAQQQQQMQAPMNRGGGKGGSPQQNAMNAISGAMGNSQQRGGYSSPNNIAQPQQSSGGKGGQQSSGGKGGQMPQQQTSAQSQGGGKGGGYQRPQRSSYGGKGG